MPRPALPFLAVAAALAGCATVPAEGPIDDREAGMGNGACNAQPAQRFIGRTADQQTGAAIMRESGARSLRWGPPGAVFTMDFRQDRVNVMYDESSTITEIRCG
ncbi:I78 family peptidase inhibitor [Qipengyuania sp. MTN3-11]|uniref:I78 family peptidase inhibitor n=1 Tax=Qipengyuania sp. MTN3-11 TaxID=3056557 RepID=UPI0036F2E9A6